MDEKLFNDIERFLREPNNEESPLLSQEDVEMLIMSLAIHRGEEGFTEDEAIDFIRWAERQLVGEAMVQLVLKGYAWVDAPTGDWEDPLIGLTTFGEQEKKKLT